MWQHTKNYYHLATALLANVRYGFPSRKLTIIGVTGTSGKTTTTHMIYQLLKDAGYKVSLLSSIKAVIGDEELDTGFHVTTPDPQVLPKYLRQAVQKGSSYFVLEVSSHALDQNRVAGISFAVGVLTTLAHEHLDYHKTMENYARAKFKLLRNAKHVVLPAVGISDALQQAVGYKDIVDKSITFGLRTGDVTQEKMHLSLHMPGDFNLLNALSAVAVGRVLKIPEKKIKQSLENFSGLLGRYEEVPTKRDFRVIIDFAHKPDALAGVLESAKKQLKGKGRIIVLYGCASERDTLKRPIMGEISGRLAEVTILTDEDPRHEEPIKIINEIAKGCLEAGAKEKTVKDVKRDEKNHVFYKIPKRKEAIAFAITKLAGANDIVLCCGKGHEASMNYNGVEKPWSEHKAVEEALKKL